MLVSLVEKLDRMCLFITGLSAAFCQISKFILSTCDVLTDWVGGLHRKIFGWRLWRTNGVWSITQSIKLVFYHTTYFVLSLIGKFLKGLGEYSMRGELHARQMNRWCVRSWTALSRPACINLCSPTRQLTSMFSIELHQWSHNFMVVW